MRIGKRTKILLIIFGILIVGSGIGFLVWRLNQKEELSPGESEAGNGADYTKITSETLYGTANEFGSDYCVGLALTSSGADLQCMGGQDNRTGKQHYSSGHWLVSKSDTDPSGWGNIGSKTYFDTEDPSGYTHRAPFCTTYQLDSTKGGYGSYHILSIRDATGRICGLHRDDNSHDDGTSIKWQCFKNRSVLWKQCYPVDQWGNCQPKGGSFPGPDPSEPYFYKYLEWPKCAACDNTTFNWSEDGKSVEFTALGVNLDNVDYTQSKPTPVDNVVEFKILIKDGDRVVEESKSFSKKNQDLGASGSYMTDVSLNCKTPIDIENRDRGGTHTNPEGATVNTEEAGYYRGNQSSTGGKRGEQCTFTGTLNVRDALGSEYVNATGYTVEVWVRGRNFVGTRWEDFWGGGDNGLWQPPDWKIPGSTNTSVCSTTIPTVTSCDCENITTDFQGSEVNPGDVLNFTLTPTSPSCSGVDWLVNGESQGISGNTFTYTIPADAEEGDQFEVQGIVVEGSLVPACAMIFTVGEEPPPPPPPPPPGEPGLQILKTSNVYCIDANTQNPKARVDYTIQVWNNGEVDTVLESVVDRPSRTQSAWLVQGSIDPSSGVMQEDCSSGVCLIDNITWEVNQSISPGDAPLEFKYSIIIPKENFGSYHNVVTAYSEDDEVSDDEDIYAACKVPPKTGVLDNVIGRVGLGILLLIFGLAYIGSGKVDSIAFKFYNDGVSRLKSGGEVEYVRRKYQERVLRRSRDQE